MRLIDLSHPIEHGMVTYKGLPAPVICDHLTFEASRALYEAGEEFSRVCWDVVGGRPIAGDGTGAATRSPHRSPSAAGYVAPGASSAGRTGP